ncbi:hypothetical protein A2442_01135 [Candidatus Campbellbacteria bacterium RIFOXYC2_FULL_35_25]|uniref:histidine kinase n=1 Tax=Candidatus Campbellbacteria bacterium RIFOXYC2_FULL_35_25 TaxID=1797582 RepID=A0A1F5EJ42_9BACT|nr:MAG: hypothetical protein A2442_01135 [Candidatus Campbellbacteria bacterium RIFOXYC2_FULL_35_25]
MKKKEISTLLSFIAEGLILFDKNGLITLVNPHATLLLDYTSGELLGKKLCNVVDIYINKTKIGKNTITEVIFKEGKAFNTPPGKVVSFKSRGGRIFPVFISAKSIGSTIGLGDSLGGVLIFRDITTEKELENYKLNTAKRLARLTPVLQKTSIGNLDVRVNVPSKEDEFTELFVGLNLMMDDLEELEKTRRESEQEKMTAVFAAESEKRKLTEKYSKELEKQVKEKTRELNQSKLHIETIIENLTNGLLEFDNDYQLVRINRTAEALLGVERKAVVGKKINFEGKDPTLASLVEVIGPKPSKGIKNYLGKEKSSREISTNYPIERDLNISTVPIFSNLPSKKNIGFIKIIRDITREKIISKSKSEFISIAAHQLRTPLSGIKWALQTLIQDKKIDDKQRDLLNKSLETNNRMINLVGDLLNVARIEEGRFGYEFKKNNIEDLISSIISNSEIVAKEKKIKIIFRNSKSFKPFIFDENKISLAIQNLIDNAIKYTPVNGFITIKLFEKDDYVNIEITDTGIGIPENQLDRMFTKFFRAKNVMKISTSGSGLGLFIAKNVVDKHEGFINFVSKEGEGSTFTLGLPLNKNFIHKEDEVIAG